MFILFRRKKILFIAVAFFTSTCEVNSQTSALVVEPYKFVSNNNDTVESELGHLKVPENRTHSKSKQIELTFVRFRCTGSKPGAPIVFLAGGPGNSGINAAKSRSRFPLFMAMREFGDVIALDQRGTGMTVPALGCDYSLTDFPLDVPPTRELLIQKTREKSSLCVAFWKEKGVDLSGYNTIESAKDVEDLRIALQTPKLILWSLSYGTHLALAAIKLFPERIEKAILAGTEGLDQTLKLPSDNEKMLRKINAFIKTDKAVQAKVPDLIVLIKKVLAQLDKKPVNVIVKDPDNDKSVNVTVSKFVMQYVTAMGMGTGDMFAYPMFYYQASKGNYKPVAEYWYDNLKSGIGSAMSFMMDCSSGASAGRLKKIKQQTGETLLGNESNLVYPEVCDVWGSPDLGIEFRNTPVSSTPILFISGTLDGRTPPSNVEEIIKQFPNGKHLIVENAIHSDPLFLATPDILANMKQFMKTNSIYTSHVSSKEKWHFVPVE